MRLLEALQLRVADIDLGRREIIIRKGKGQRERRTVLPGVLVARLRSHLATIKIQHEEDISLGAGAVALPTLALTLGTDAPPTLPAPWGGSPRVIVSRSRPPAAATWLADQLDGELVEMGSAGAKAMAVVRGEADVYAHSGGQYEWDSCAPAAVARAVGLHVSRLDGSPLRYNNADPYLPDLLICRPELAQPALEALSRFES